MSPILTPRLCLREFTLADAPFVLQLLNDPDFIRFIADKGVRSIADAEAYLQAGPLASYAANGFGLWAVAHRQTGELLGYAFMPQARGQGYAVEAAAAARAYGLDVLALPQVVGFIDPANRASAKVLQAIGLQSQGMVSLPGVDGDTELFA